VERIRRGKSANDYLNFEKYVGARRNRPVPADLPEAIMVKWRHLVPADTGLD